MAHTLSGTELSPIRRATTTSAIEYVVAAVEQQNLKRRRDMLDMRAMHLKLRNPEALIAEERQAIAEQRKLLSSSVSPRGRGLKAREHVVQSAALEALTRQEEVLSLREELQNIRSPARASADESRAIDAARSLSPRSDAASLKAIEYVITEHNEEILRRREEVVAMKSQLALMNNVEHNIITERIAIAKEKALLAQRREERAQRRQRSVERTDTTQV